MTSLLTNIAAQTALQTLMQTSDAVGVSRHRLSAGDALGSASGDGAYWSVHTAMCSDNAALSTVEAALGIGSATVDVAYGATNQVVGVMQEFRTTLTTARQPGADRAPLQDDIGALQTQLRDIAAAAAFSDENWLSVDSSLPGFTASKTVLASFSRTGSTMTFGTITIDTTAMVLFDACHASDATHCGLLDGGRVLASGALAADGIGDGAPPFSIAGAADGMDISALTDSAADLATLEAYVRAVDAALGELTAAVAALGSAKTNINLQKTFVTALMEDAGSGMGQLVDPDMDEEAARLQALQVQAQLGTQVWSITNAAS